MTHRRRLLTIATGFLAGAMTFTVIAIISPDPARSALGVAALLALALAACFFAGANDIDEPPSGKAHV